MKAIKLILLLAIITQLFSCAQIENNSISTVPYKQVNQKVDSLEQSFMDWWTYYNREIMLSSNFIPLDTSYVEISKADFLQSLRTGAYIPFKLKSKNGSTYYRLSPLSTKANEDIVTTMQRSALIARSQYQREGQVFPDFEFTALDGKVYNNQNTQGKYLILKCWFIACTSCVREFSDLNKLVDQYKNRSDIEFISLAYDDEEALLEFLSKKPFNYATASVPAPFMHNEMKVGGYPTHFIIDPDGMIKKVVNSYHELEVAMEEIL
ncbi:MAG: TlpA disulfide reductase family protein [Bacteroidota bacterium]